jgi:8-oxo-dGTP diphosphatase
MSREEKTILTNMCMVYDDHGNVLVQDRLEANWPGLTFPGGHVEPKESFVASVIREVKEETGLDIKNPTLCGIKQWYTDADARYVVLFFKTNQFSGTLRSSDEGKVFWISREELHHRKLASDMDEMLSIFESDDLTEFYYYYNEDGSWGHTIL